MFFAFRGYFRGVREERWNLFLVYSLVWILCLATSATVLTKALKWKDPAEVFLTSFLVSMIISTFAVLGALRGRERLTTGRTMAHLLVIALCFSAFAFGGNDIANATGVFVTPTEVLAGRPTVQSMILLAMLGALFVAVGGFTWGHRVIRTTAYKVTRLEPLTGLAAEYSNALTVFLFTVVPKLLIGFGIPVSTTHSSVGSIIGVALASKGVLGIDRATTGKIVSFWVLTIPCVALTSVGLFWLVDFLVL
jgi:phosphate/sulfate permease